MGKGAGSVSILGGADGVTSIFIVGKDGKVKLTTRIQNYFRIIKRNRIKKQITANAHTLEEVVEWLKREHGAVEVSQQSHNYLEQKQFLKASLIMRHRPDLFGELINLELPEEEDVEALEAFCEKIQERRNRAAKIADDIFPINYPFVFMDCIHYKVREDGRILSRAAYIVLGIAVGGYKDILGITVGANETSKFWLGMLNDLKNRGVQDVLFFCVDQSIPKPGFRGVSSIYSVIHSNMSITAT